MRPVFHAYAPDFPAFIVRSSFTWYIFVVILHLAVEILKLCKILSAVIAVSMLFTSAYAHSGRTDSSGGHYNHSTGEYHYHHGYPAHQHTDGVCPYDFDDKTGENSGEKAGPSNQTQTKESAQTEQNIRVEKAEKPEWFGILEIFGILFCASFGTIFAIACLFSLVEIFVCIVLSVMDVIRKTRSRKK